MIRLENSDSVKKGNGFRKQTSKTNRQNDVSEKAPRTCVRNGFRNASQNGVQHWVFWILGLRSKLRISWKRGKT